QRRVEVAPKGGGGRGGGGKGGAPGGGARARAAGAGRAGRACVRQGRSAKMPSMPASLEPPAARGRVGYVVKVFPRLSETFVINEIRELESRGVEVSIFTLHAPAAEVPHRLLATLRAPITRVDALPEPSDAECRTARAALRPLLPEAAALGDRLLPPKYGTLAL